MSTDLEHQLRDELVARAEDAGEWRTPGAALRRTSAEHRTRKLHVMAVAGVAAAVLVLVTGVTLGLGRDSADGPPATPEPTTSTRSAHVPVSPDVLQRARMDLALGNPELVASARLPKSGDLLLVLRSSGAADVQPPTTVATVTVHDGTPLTGTTSDYDAGDEVVAQPARDGAGATFVVHVPPGMDADAAIVTTSAPGKDIVNTTAPLVDGLALVEIRDASQVTQVRLLHGAATIHDVIPGEAHVLTEVPSPLPRIIVSSGGDQPVQVRTDGRTACRLTAAGLSQPDAFALDWNPFDEACAPIDGSLQLLIAQDRRYSSVAGIAPPGTGFIRLHFTDGVREVPVADGEVPAFIDTSGHRPDRLTRAQAISPEGDEIARAVP